MVPRNPSLLPPFYRLNEGDAIGEANTTFTGTGLDDAFFAGHFKGPTAQTYYVRIDGVGTGAGGVDTFEVALGNDSNFASPIITKERACRAEPWREAPAARGAARACPRP